MKGSVSLLCAILLLTCASCSWYHEHCYWSILQFEGEQTERIFLEFDDADLEDVVKLRFKNGVDFRDDLMTLKFYVDQPWVVFPGLNDNKTLISSAKDDVLEVPIKIINEGLSSGAHQATITIAAGNGQKLEVVVKMKHVPRIEISEGELVFAVNETEKELYIKSYDCPEKVFIKKPSDAIWLDVSPTELIVPKYIVNDQSTIAKVIVSVNRSSVNYGSYKATLDICSENGVEIAAVPVEMQKDEFGDQVASSGNILFKIIECRPNNDGELNIALAVKNTGSLNNEVVSFLRYSYSSSPKYPAFAIDNCGNAYEAIVRFHNYSSSKSFASGEEAEANITIKNFKHSDISNISYLHLPLEGRSSISFQNIDIQGRPKNDPDFTPITSSTLLDAPRELDVQILHSFYDSSNSLNIEYVVENTTEDYVDVVLDASRLSFCAYDDSGKQSSLDAIRLCLEETFISTNAKVWLPPRVKCRGTVFIDDADANSLQYLRVPVVVNGNISEMTFSDVEINGKTKPELPESIAEASVSVHGHIGTVDLHVTKCYDTSSETVIEFRIENHLSQHVSVTANLDLCWGKDEYSICYTPKKMMMAGVLDYDESCLLPIDTYVTGKVNFPKIDDLSAAFKELQVSCVIDTEFCSFELGSFAIEGRDPSKIIPQEMWQYNGVTFNLIGCYEESGNLIIDYLLTNTTRGDIELAIDDTGRAYDDMANEYHIELANGLYYERPKLASESSYRSQIIIRSFSPIASILSYFKLVMDIGSLRDVVMELRDIKIACRERNELPPSELTYDVVQSPDKIDMELVNAEFKNGQCFLSFRIKNNSSGTQKIKWDLYDSDSYAIIGEDQHYISVATIGFASYETTYAYYELPGKVMVSGTLVIPDVSVDCKVIDKLFMGHYNSTPYEFAKIVISE